MAMPNHPASSSSTRDQAPSRIMLLAYATGGAWSDEEAASALGVTADVVQAWHRDRRVLAMPDDDGVLVYPAIQFMPGTQGEAAILPGMARVIAAAGHLHPREVFGLLASHQGWLATKRERARTPFAALAAGDADAVIAMLAHILTPDDLDAPPMKCTVCGSAEAWPTGMTDPDLGQIFLCARHRGRSFDYT